MAGEDKVLLIRETDVPIEIDAYRRSEANIRRLSERLPENLMMDLAREVILRVASKQDALKHVPYEATEEELELLCTALISDDETAAATVITNLRADGVHPEDIYFKQLAAAARLLGEKWESDTLSFSQVTIGTGRMFSIMRSMRHLFEPKIVAQDKTAIFASVPGEDHTLGVHMAADMFRKEGWEIALKVGLDHDELVKEIENAPSSIVGLSISGEHSIEALSRLVVALHICCPHAILLVSGSNVDAVRPILSLMGLDGIAGSVDEARDQLERLWQTNMVG
ncbi:cobalamin-dependent protein [Rhodobacteraceae bacterium]|nr:cobalamin-dependent protein [Paracoccaceae bacterium]